MKKAIWKFPLRILQLQTIEMPEGSKVLTVQLQMPYPCIWAECNTDPECKKGVRTFEHIDTGDTFEELEEGKERVYVGTYQKGPYVGHIFEIISK